MPRLELSLELELVPTGERDMLCWICDLPGPEWKLALQTRRSVIWRGIHTDCKIDVESRKHASSLMQAVKPK